MSGVTKLGLALLLVFALAFLALLAELLYILCYRRRSAAASADLEGGASEGVASKELLLYFLCWKNQSRIEPAAEASPVKPAAAAEAEEVDELALWRAVCHGSSRALYTIEEEEEEREREASESEARDRECGSAASDKEEATPCSTPFYTPFSSPARALQAGEIEPLSPVD